MIIVLGSENIPKRDSVANAFGLAYPGEEINVSCIKTESGVSSHPTSAQEAVKGAINRANNAQLQSPNGDYFVGIEGGLLQVDDRAWEIGWVAILDCEGKIAVGLSAGIELKGRLLKAILDGQELNDVLDDIYGIGKIGNSNGFYGLATDDLVTRQQAYEQGIHFALAQYKHPELF